MVFREHSAIHHRPYPFIKVMEKGRIKVDTKTAYFLSGRQTNVCLKKIYFVLSFELQVCSDK